MPPEEKTFWHDHKYEVDAGLLKSLTQSGEEKATLAKVRTFMARSSTRGPAERLIPRPARLFWAVTGEEPFVLAPRAAKANRGRRPES